MNERRHTKETDYRFEERANEMMNDAYWDGFEDARESAPQKRRFRRNTIDGNIAGVCAGIADYLGWEIFVVRLIFVASLFFTGGTTFWLYVLLWICVPEDHRAPYIRETRQARKAARKDARRYARNDAVPVRRKTEKLTDVRSKFRSIETRMQELERSITSKEWQLRRDFRDLED